MKFNDIFQNDYILERHIIRILDTYFQPYIHNSRHYNFRCNICGDSKKSKNKKRGYIYKKENGWIYYCHNGCGGVSVLRWMKEWFPSFYNDYIKEILSTKKENIPRKVIEVKPLVRKINAEEIEDVKKFIPIKKGTGELFDLSIKLCKERLIPEEVYNKWFVSIDNTYKNRIIIPFYNDKNKIYYWQGRALYDWMIPKYLSRSGYNLNNIYNYYTVNRDIEVIILEGMIDSLFIENAIAMTGLKIYDEKLKRFKKRYFLLDPDEDGKEKTLKLLNKGEYVFNWNKFIKNFNLPPHPKGKWDINDVVIHLNRTTKFTFEELKPYFTNSIYDKVNFII